MLRYYLIVVLLTSVFGVNAQSKSDQASAAYDLALKNYRSRNLEEALAYIEAALELSQQPQYYYLNGLIFEAQEKDLRAVSAYEATLKLDPNYQEALFQKALIYLKYGDPKQAIRDFNLLIDMGVSFTRGVYFESDAYGSKGTSLATLANLESKFYYYRAQAHSKLGDYDAALKDFNVSIELDSASDYYMGRGLLYQKMKEPQLAINDFRRAVFQDSSNQLAWYNLALVYPSVELPEDLLADNTFSPTLGLLASEAMTNGNYQKAIRYLSQALETDKEPLHFINRGRAYAKIKKYDLARQDFLQARKLDPAHFECLYLIGNSYFFEKRFELAVSFYNQFLTVDPKNAMVWYNGAMSYLEMKQKEEACHYLNQANNLGMVQATEMIDKHCR